MANSKKEMIEEIALLSGFNKNIVEQVYSSLISFIENRLKDEKEVRLLNLGTIFVDKKVIKEINLFGQGKRSMEANIVRFRSSPKIKKIIK